MADVFITEDCEDCVEENDESILLKPSSEIKVVIEGSMEPKELLNDKNYDINEEEKRNAEMTLKQGESESDNFAADDLLVIPDDLLSAVVKLENFGKSGIVFNRQVVARNLLQTLHMVHENPDELSRVLNVLCSISEDYDQSVRLELMVQLPHIAAYCKEVALNHIINQYLVPILISCLGDENNQVRKSTHSALLSMIEQRLITSDTIDEKICPLVIHLTDSAHPEELRTDSIVLMSKLAVLMGKQAAEDFFLEHLFTLCADGSNNVRKTCASTFGDFCTTVGRETTEELLLPKFFNLCEDTAWCVRKACTENFMPVSCVVSREIRCKELASLYMVLLYDQSRWVRLTAYHALGPFISTFAEPDKTGLYYSKDGVLTVIDTPYLPVQETVSMLQKKISDEDSSETISNCKISDTFSCNGDYSSLDRTNSSNPCDSVVPPCSNETTVSDSDLFNPLCHANNYCSVIEVSSPSMTLATASKGETEAVESDTVSNLCSANSSHCDPKHVSEIVISGDFSSVTDSCSNSTVVKQSNWYIRDKDKCCSKSDKEAALFNKLWCNALCGCNENMPLVNGDLMNDVNGIDNSVENHLDSNIVKNSVAAEVDSKLLSSVTINGVNISSSVALAGPMSCEAIPLINCTNSLTECKTYLKKTFSSDELPKEINESYHSIDNCFSEQDTSTNLIQRVTFSGDSEEPFNIPKNNNETVTLVSTKLKVIGDETSNGESAFNHFQYWRTPLPDIDIDSDLCDSSSTRKLRSDQIYFKDYSVLSTKERLIQNRRIWEPNDFFRHRVSSISGISSNGDFSREYQLSENKEGEPPPGEKQLSVHDQDIVPPELLLRYLSMIDAAWAQTIDAEIARHCAYSLPAVALTLGRKFWPCLKETFNALSSDLQGFIMMWKVRRTVAASMHQLAVILGPHITSTDLLPVFSRFINDLDEVRVGVLQHMYEFLKVLRPEERRGLLLSLPEFLLPNSDTDVNEKNWRFRLTLAEQLVLIADLYEPQDVRDHLVPLSLTLIEDKICEVRLAAVRVMAAVMRRMSRSPTQELTKAVLSELTEKFIHAPKWLHRQLYVYICQEFIVENSLPPDQFAEDALPQLLYLCWDRVPNVRIAIARCLAVVIWPLDTFSNPHSPHRDLLLQTIHTLQSDVDADVRFYANMVSTHECSCLQHGEFTNIGEPYV